MATIQADSPLAAELTRIVQPKLVDLGWESSGDDNTLTEYILLMLVNGKTEEQIASELSNDLLSLGPDDPVATDFARWLFEQVAILTNPSSQGPSSNQPGSAQAIPSFTGDMGSSSSQQGPGGNDASMGDAMDGLSQEGMYVNRVAIRDPRLTKPSPTGPKSMRNNQRGTGRRMMGHLNKAMDRSDASLHRIKGQGAGRINVHERGPPRGPRANSGPGRNGIPTGPRGAGGRGVGMGGPNGPNMGISPQQQMQLLAFYEQQAKLMSSILSPQQQQNMMGGMPAPAINPAFQHKPQGKSLFDRVDKRPNGRGNRGAHGESAGDDMTMDMGEGKSDPAETICKFNLKCTKADCPFAHQSPAAPQGVSIDVQDVCSFGAACQNRKCVGRHPSPAQRKQHASETDCKFFPNCTNPQCPFQHPSMPLCRNGADCTQEGCKFTHLKTMCKYNPCMNPKCPYKHEEGQRKRTFGDMQWRAGDKDGNEHVSERKFVVEGGDEELIVPGPDGSQHGAPTATSEDVEIAT